MFAIPAAITMGSASQSLAALCQAIDNGETDIGGASLAHSDSSAVAVLLAAIRHGQLAGKAVRITGLPASLCSLAKLYGVGHLIADDAAPASATPATPAA